jgi:hypothetical protein
MTVSYTFTQHTAQHSEPSTLHRDQCHKCQSTVAEHGQAATHTVTAQIGTVQGTHHKAVCWAHCPTFAVATAIAVAVAAASDAARALQTGLCFFRCFTWHALLQ